jgi:cobalt/nickel transport system ATP-binding protein
VLVDGPTAYLDPVQTRALCHSLERIRAAGTTIVVATHDLEFVYAWADWLMVMDQGRIVLEGTAQEVFAHRTVLRELGLGLPLVMDILTDLPMSKTDLERIHEILRDRLSR